MIKRYDHGRVYFSGTNVHFNQCPACDSKARLDNHHEARVTKTVCVECGWKYSHHPKGWGFVNHTLKMFYVAIPKNASSSMKQVLVGKFGFEAELYQDVPNIETYTTIAVLRDPYKRFASALNQINKYVHSRDVYAPGAMDDLVKRLYAGEVQDPHVELQSWFLEGTSNVTFIFLDELDTWFKEHFRVKLPHYNKSKIDISKSPNMSTASQAALGIHFKKDIQLYDKEFAKVLDSLSLR
jgi:Zn ribbon nucleic-acid-binding protein